MIAWDRKDLENINLPQDWIKGCFEIVNIEDNKVQCEFCDTPYANEDILDTHKKTIHGVSHVTETKKRPESYNLRQSRKKLKKDHVTEVYNEDRSKLLYTFSMQCL